MEPFPVTSSASSSSALVTGGDSSVFLVHACLQGVLPTHAFEVDPALLPFWEAFHHLHVLNSDVVRDVQVVVSEMVGQLHLWFMVAVRHWTHPGTPTVHLGPYCKFCVNSGRQVKLIPWLHASCHLPLSLMRVIQSNFERFLPFWTWLSPCPFPNIAIGELGIDTSQRLHTYLAEAGWLLLSFAERDHRRLNGASVQRFPLLLFIPLPLLHM